MFSGYMLNTWLVGTLVAVVGGAVGFFVVLRGSAFVAHAIPNGSFAGAAGASLAGVSTLLGLGVFSAAGALGIATLSRRGRRDVATALALVFMLGLGSLFLSLTPETSGSVFALLFGEAFGVSRGEILPTAALVAACLGALAILWRPLLLTSLLPDAAGARRGFLLDLAFLLLVALSTTVTVPVVGTTLIFSLLVGPAATARSLTADPTRALGLSVAVAVGILWVGLGLAYLIDWPVGFFVGVLSAAAYLVARLLRRGG